MKKSNTSDYLLSVFLITAKNSTQLWLNEKVISIISNTSTRELYMTYSLLASKLSESGTIHFAVAEKNAVTNYLKLKNASVLEVARIYLLAKVLEENSDFFTEKVANLIQVADTKELETLLTYLHLLPNAENFIHTATEALRSNISSVFNAIALNNPYPGLYFNDQQWNQMYLKAVFIETDLSQILNIEQKANAGLARIISDYAHERWAASRTIDPLFWRPVIHFLDATLLNDMQRLLESTNQKENYAGALCCYFSESEKAKDLLNNYPEIKTKIEQQKLSWNSLISKN